MNAGSEARMIMIVDDFPSTLMVLEKMLKHAGHRVRTFPGGKEALNAVEEVNPDLVLLDVNMPDMDGYEVCTRLKGNALTAEVPILFLSAADEPMDKVKAFNCGASDYLTKPYHPGEILARVGVYLQAQALHDQTLLLQQELNKARDAMHGSRLKELEELMGEFTSILIHDGRSPVSMLANSLNSLKSGVQGKLAKDEMTNLDAAVTYCAQLTQLFQKCLKVMSARSREKKK